MPKNTQMHMQWITVNGQSVPLVLPQYWDGEKWVISSEQNPLPVKAELTGSNNVIINQRLDALVTSGTRMFVLSQIDVSNFSKVYVGVRSEAPHDWDILFSWGFKEHTYGTTTLAFQKIEGVTNGDRISTEHYEVKGQLAWVAIENKSSEDHYYDVRLMGVR